MNHFKCSRCGGNIGASESQAGRKENCPECGKLQTIPLYPRGPGVTPIETLECRVHLSGGYSYQQMASFRPGNGLLASPSGQIVADSRGNLYGFASGGGANGTGGVYEIPAKGGTPITLASFPSAESGRKITAIGPAIDHEGNLFGAMQTGGDAANDGMLFEIPKGGHRIKILADFNRSISGGSPQGTILVDAVDDLYGVTSNGGGMGCGAVWELPVGTKVVVPLALFSPVVVNGVSLNPQADSIATDGTGNFFGTTFGDPPAASYGSVWELPAGKGAVTTLASFDGTDGSGPIGAVALDGYGGIYGVTEYGGDNINSAGSPLGSGTVWSFNGSGDNSLQSLTNFDSPAVGEYPVGGVAIDPNMNLFGTTSAGGSTTSAMSGDGTAWEIPEAFEPLQTIETFSANNGDGPPGGVIDDIFDDIYGTTLSGGPSGGGTAFKLEPNAASPSSSGLEPSVVKATLPADVLPGSVLSGSVTIKIVNSTQAATNGAFKVSLFASNDGTIDSTAQELESVERTLGISSGSSLELTLPIHRSLPQELRGAPAILVQLMDRAGDVYAGTVGPRIEITFPVVWLAPSIVSADLPAPLPFYNGEESPDTVTVKIANVGTMAVNTPGLQQNFGVDDSVIVYASLDGALDDAIAISASIPLSRTIEPGGSTLVRLQLFDYFPGVNGHFRLIVEVSDESAQSNGFPSSFSTPSASTYAMREANAVLNATINSFSPNAIVVGSSAEFTISITLTNAGDIPLGATKSTEIGITVDLVPQVAPSGEYGVPAPQLDAVARLFPLSPGQSSTLLLSFTASLLRSVISGTYFPFVSAGAAGTSAWANVQGTQPIEVSGT